MLQNIIKNRRNSDFQIKAVYGSENEAEDALEILEEYKNRSKEAFEKMRLLYGLRDIQLTTVAHALFIVYHFNGSKECKEFEISFSRNINDDGSNLAETFMIAQKESDNPEDEQFIIKLKLPSAAVEALNRFEGLMSVTMESEPSCPVFRDMVFYNNKNVKLADKDFDKQIINVVTIYNGSKIIRAVPQRWLDIEEKSYKGIVNTQWALNPKNIIRMVDGGVYSYFNNKEVFTPMDIIKDDGRSLEFYRRDNGYYEPISQLILSPEHIIFK